MRANLEAGGDLLMSEAAVTALTPSLGRGAAQELVKTELQRAVERGSSLRAALEDTPAAVEALGREGIAAAFVPRAYLGAADQLIDRALTAHRERRG
jgi:3-carboxy-cis,cis-muconate cycloisomerase